MGGRQLFCIGYPEDCIFDASGAPSMTCLVDFDFQSASSGFDTWKYNIFLAVHDGEMLMDVSDSHNGILTVSSFSGSHYKIGIRYSKYGPLSSAHNQSMINVINVFDTYSMLVDTRGVNTSWRDAKDRLFIDGSTVAHVSHNAATGDHGVSFYRFDDTYFAINQGITMSDAHYHVANDGVKLIDLRDYMYRGQNGYRDNTSALLDDPQSGLSIIQKETWNNSGMYLTTELNSNWASLMLRSINPYEQNDHLFSVGYRTEDRGLMIEGHDSDFPSARLPLICLDKRFGKGFSVSPLPEPVAGQGLYLHDHYRNFDIDINAILFTASEVNSTIQCMQLEHN